jgi:HSP20 family protein
MTTLTKNALRDIDRIKNLVLGAPPRYEPEDADRETQKFPVDIYETQDAFVVVADLPGVSKDDLTVRVLEDRLQIAGTRRNAGTADYTRSFRLPDSAAKQDVQARLKDGVLTVKLPKPDRMKPIHIPVTADSNFTI